MIERRYYIMERQPNWKCWQVIPMAIAGSKSSHDACFKEKKKAEQFYEMVSSARVFSSFQIVIVEVKPNSSPK